MSVSRNAYGPLIYSTLTEIDSVVFWGQTRPPEIGPLDSDIGHTVRISDRIDLLASQFLGDSQLGWAILERNGMRLMPNDLVPGVKIFIPTRQSLLDRGIIS